MFNNQKPLKKLRDSGSHLWVHSIFMTIQGEGPFSGHPAVFVRLSGCNLQCPFCDTEYTDNSKKMSNGAIKSEILKLHTIPLGLVVITGGEPFRQNITRLVNFLIGNGYTVQIETNGTLTIDHDLNEKVHIVCSPKTDKLNSSLKEREVVYKYVIEHNGTSTTDGLPIRALGNKVTRQVARPPGGSPVYVSPMDSKNVKLNTLNIKETVNSVMKHGHILSLQTHKLIGVEN